MIVSFDETGVPLDEGGLAVSWDELVLTHNQLSAYLACTDENRHNLNWNKTVSRRYPEKLTELRRPVDYDEL